MGLAIVISIFTSVICLIVGFQLGRRSLHNAESAGTSVQKESSVSNGLVNETPADSLSLLRLDAPLGTGPAQTATNGVLQNEHAQSGRLWNDTTGEFSVLADYVEATQKEVTLRTIDGETLVVALSKLSEKDKKYALDQLKLEIGDELIAAEDLENFASAEFEWNSDGRIISIIIGDYQKSRGQDSVFEGLKKMPFLKYLESQASDTRSLLYYLEELNQLDEIVFYAKLTAVQRQRLVSKLPTVTIIDAANPTDLNSIIDAANPTDLNSIIDAANPTDLNSILDAAN